MVYLCLCSIVNSDYSTSRELCQGGRSTRQTLSTDTTKQPHDEARVLCSLFPLSSYHRPPSCAPIPSNPPPRTDRKENRATGSRGKGIRKKGGGRRENGPSRSTFLPQHQSFFCVICGWELHADGDSLRACSSLWRQPPAVRYGSDTPECPCGSPSRVLV